MSRVFNKRNALLGWATWSVGKRIARRKAKEAVPAVERGRPNNSAILATIAAIGGLVVFWRKRRHEDEPLESA